MPTLNEIFDKRKIFLYQNESLDLDHYYQEPYQDENDEIKEMSKPFETDESKKIRTFDLLDRDRTYSGFGYFMDGSRRTYKIGDMVLEGKKIFPVVVAQIRAGCTERNQQKKLHTHGSIKKKNLLLLSDRMNEVDFQEIRQRILKTQMAKDLYLDIVKYHFDSTKDNVPVNAAIAKANSKDDVAIIVNECVGNRCDNSNNWEPNRGTEDDNRSSINNNMNIRIFKYWQEIVATWLLISVGIGTLWYLFKIFGLNGSKDKTVVSFLGIFYPWFIYIAGVILIFACGIGLFKVYLSVMLSMNVTRKSAVRQIAVMLAELSAVICLVIGIVWKIEEAVIGEQIEMLSAIWVMFSILLIVCAVTMAAGAIVVKWGGKVLVLISLITGVLVGGIVGALTVINFKDLDMISLRIIRIDRIFTTVSVNVKWVSAGILIFILAYFLARKLTCRLEAR